MAMPYVAVASSPMAATLLLMSCIPATSTATATATATATPTAFVTRCSALPYLPPPLSASSGHFSGSRRFSSLQVRASSSEETSFNTEELFMDLKRKWDALENKSTVLLYGGGAIVAAWLSSVLVGAVNSVPLLPKIMELVGVGYTAWFVYRYLLFKSSRKELATDIEALKKKVTGAE